MFFIIFCPSVRVLGEQRVQSVAVTEELKMRETQLDELRKQLVQWEGKLRTQQQLYEAVRSDRNHYSKGMSIYPSV